MAAKLTIEATIADLTGSAVAGRLPATSAPREFASWVVWLFTAFVSGLHRARIRARVDESVGVAAAITITAVQASLVAGDALTVTMADGKVFRFRAVAGTPDPTAGEFAIITSNTAVANSLRAAMAYTGLPGFAPYIAATGTTTLVLTARTPGSLGNAIRVGKEVTTAGAFTGQGLMTGGIDPGAAQSVTIAFSGVGTNADVLNVGGQVFTLVAASANENQITIGGTAAATVVNAVAIINANSKTRGLVFADIPVAATLRLTLLESGRIGLLVPVTKTSTAMGSPSAATFVSSTTETYVAGASGLPNYNLGSL